MAEMIFYALAGLAILSGLAILVGRSLPGISVWLIVLLTAVSGLLFLEGEWTAAAVQLVLLAGGMGTFFVAITRRLAENGDRFVPGSRWRFLWIVPLIVPAMIAMMYLATTLQGDWAARTLPRANSLIDAGTKIITVFIGPFLLLGILLIVTLLGSAHLIDTFRSASTAKPSVDQGSEGHKIEGTDK